MASPIELYIRQAAAARGIDPDIAVRVAKSEGGLTDPVRQAEYVKGGHREPSYGPYQLLIGGGGSGFPEGMGNRALAAGIDPRNPDMWQKGVDFALDQAKSGGWSPWYGAKAAGIGPMQGINGGGPALPGKIGGDSMVARNMDPQTAAATNTPQPIDRFPEAPSAPPQGLMALLKGGKDGEGGIGSLLSSLMDQKPVQPLQLNPMPQQPQGPSLSDYLQQFLQSRQV